MSNPADTTAAPNTPCVLLTGFEAFGGASLNPSWLAASALDGDVICGHSIISRQLPTTFAGAGTTLKKLLRQHQPSVVICTGLAGGRSALSLERVAINIIDARIADNAGEQPVDMAVVPGAPAAYFSSLPIKAMLLALQQAGIQAEVSQSAGTFVCNQVFYLLMHTLARQRRLGKPTAKAGFVHLPCLPEQGLPAMTLADMVTGLRIAVQTALEHRGQDLALQAGRIN